MAQNVTIAGNQYPDVPSVLIPKTGGGGNAIFADPSVVTAVASDVASGKYFLDSSGVLTQGTASGGGGASNIVTGTFTGTTTNTAMDLTLNYTGTGYPVAVWIYPTGGLESQDFSTLIGLNTIGSLMAYKYRITQPPTYPTAGTLDENRADYYYSYKSSSSNASSISPSTSYGQIYRNTNAAAGVPFRFKSSSLLSVFIRGTSYGFAANIEYSYYVIYSS